MADMQANKGALSEGVVIQGAQGQYRVEAVLNRGPQMTTVRASDALGRKLVLKELRLEALHSWKVMELFERESEILGQLDHDYLPRLVDAFKLEHESQTRFYLVCSWAEGESLLEKLNDGWQPQADEIHSIAHQALELLDYLHRFNPPIIHRDLKPANLILDEAGRLHLVDFGAVQGLLNPDGGSTVVGTFGYMPPEQFSDRCVPASDLYALGATLVHLLTGKFPSDLPRKGLRLDYGALPADSPLSPAWLDRLLAPELEGRFPSVREALDALETCLDQKPESVDPCRIQTQRRGAKLLVTIRPAPRKRAYGWAGGLSLGWLGTLLCFQQLYQEGLSTPSNLYRLLVDFGISYDQATGLVNNYTFNLIWELMLGLHLAEGSALIAGFVLLQGTISAGLQTRIQIQPERYRVTQSLGRFSWKAEGTTSELTGLQRRFSLIRMAWVNRWVERSGVALTGGLQLNHAEHRDLTRQISTYLAQSRPEQAQTLLANSLPVTRPLRPGGLATRLQIRPETVGQGKRAWLERLLPPSQHAFWLREVPWLPQHPRLQARLADANEMNGHEQSQALELLIRPKPRIWQSMALGAAWVQGVMAPAYSTMAIRYLSIQQEMQTDLISGWDYSYARDLDALNALGISYLLFSLCNGLIFGLIYRYLVSSMSRQSVRLDAGSLSRTQTAWPRRRRQRQFALQDWQGLSYRRGQLRIQLTGGGSECLADQLNQTEAQAIAQLLQNQLQVQSAPVPVMLDQDFRALVPSSRHVPSVLEPKGLVAQPQTRASGLIKSAYRRLYHALGKCALLIREQLRPLRVRQVRRG